MRMPLISRRTLLAAVGASAFGVQAQGSNMLWLVPQPAGNPTDALARRILPGLQRELGTTVLIENLPGAGGALGVNKLLALPSTSPAL